MPFAYEAALHLFVAGTLLILSGALVVAGRRRPEHFSLALFLTLVGVNFLAASSGGLLSPSGRDRIVAITNAMDPFFLVLFVTSYPYRRRSLRGRLFLWALGGTGLLATAGAIFHSPLVLKSAGFQATPPAGFVLIIVALAVGYLAAWAFAVQACMRAPTPILGQRGAWLVLAVGVAVIPRMALLPVDFGFEPLYLFLAPPYAATGTRILNSAVSLLLSVAIMGALYGVGWRAMSTSAGPGAVPMRTAFRRLGILLLFFVLVRVAIEAFTVAAIIGTAVHFVAYAVRWIVFAGILVYGILAYEIVEFRRASSRAAPTLGAALFAWLAFLATAVVLGRLGQSPPVAVALGLAVALASLAPASWIARAVSQSVERKGAPGLGQDRRLELYEAVLDSAWAGGAPNPASWRRLENDRKTFGVSPEEARALEHAVAARFRSALPPLRPGDEVVPGVVLEGTLGEGAHGRVYRARRHPSGDRVVVKELKAELMGPAAARQRLVNEWRSLEGLRHPHLVRLLGTHVGPGRYLLLLEHIDGETLAQRLARGPLAPDTARRVLLQLLDGLRAAHEHGIVHRDIKPSNILIDSAGDAHLTDFGVAATEEDATTLRATITNLGLLGQFVGTLDYMAPEQVQEGRADAGTDLYAAGLVLYEALTGRPAVDLRGTNLFDAIERVRRPSIDFRPVPPGWRRLVSRALDPDRKRRFGSAQEMAQALQAFGSGPANRRKGRLASSRPATGAGKPAGSGPP